MTKIPTDLLALRVAIRELSPADREELAEWMLDSPDAGLAVAEAAPAYGSDGDRDRSLMTVEEYLNMAEGPTRYEYLAGHIYAMSAPLLRHETIVNNLVYHLQHQLRGGPCRAFSSNARVRLIVNNDEVFYFPDAQIACGPFTEEMLDTSYLNNSRVVVEVLSPSTARIDRSEKAFNYRQLPSVQEILLIAQRTMELTVFRRSEQWKPQVLTRPQEVFESRAAAVSVALADIYDGALSFDFKSSSDPATHL